MTGAGTIRLRGVTREYVLGDRHVPALRGVDLDIENPGGGKPRKDGKLKPMNSDFDLYSKGRDGLTKEKLDDKESVDDVVRVFDGQFINLASKF